MTKTLELNTTSSRLFFGEEGHGIARYDTVRYPIFQSLNNKMRSFEWKPNEVDVSGERRDFQRMTPVEQFVFTENLRRQIVLDSIQGRGPSLAFLPHCTDPMLENCILTWSFFESIHSESYTHIIRAIYPDPAVVVEGIPQVREIADCATAITEAYDKLQANPNEENLYLSLVSANALEALRFYVSFACTFSFAQRGLVEGSAKIVRLIARDEAVHLGLVQQIIKKLAKDDPKFSQVIGDLRKEATDIFELAAVQEEDWAKHLFKDGGILGLSEGILIDYVRYLLPKRLFAAGLTTTQPKRTDHPIPWIENWFKSSHVQVALQEAENSSYLIGILKNDLSDVQFKL